MLIMAIIENRSNNEKKKKFGGVGGGGGSDILGPITFIRALALGNVTLSYFTISKSYFINYTIPFYNTPNIPKFYFTILHIKII